MNTYERMLELIVEISKEDLEYYKGRPSRKNKGTRASKKTQAAKERATKKRKDSVERYRQQRYK